jgi:hypothetical protein
MKPVRWKLLVTLTCPEGHAFTGDEEGLRADFALDVPDDAKSAPALIYFPIHCPRCTPPLRLV